MGLNQRPKQPVVGLPGERGWEEVWAWSRLPFTQGKGWLTFMKATHCDQWPHPQPQTLAVQNSLLADGIVSLYLFPHSLLCMSAKNLPVISKLRQKVPPVLSAVNKRLPLHRNDLTRSKGCSVGLPCKDIERSTCSTGGDRCLEGTLLPTIRAKCHWISLFKICLLLLVWKLKSHILALHSQSSSATTECLSTRTFADQLW